MWLGLVQGAGHGSGVDLGWGVNWGDRCGWGRRGFRSRSGLERGSSRLPFCTDLNDLCCLQVKVTPLVQPEAPQMQGSTCHNIVSEVPVKAPLSDQC